MLDNGHTEDCAKYASEKYDSQNKCSNSLILLDLPLIYFNIIINDKLYICYSSWEEKYR